MPRNDQPCSIGEMRWLVSLACRTDTPDPDSPNLVESYRKIADIHAKIAPKVEESFIGGEEIESPVTHEITFRWQPYESLAMFDTIIRYIDLPNGERRAEVFRIRKLEEFSGRHRWIVADAELERFNL